MAPRGIAGRYYCFTRRVSIPYVGYRTACLSCCWTTGLRGYRTTLLPSYLAIEFQHCSAGCWLLIDILTALGHTSIIRRDIDGRAGSFTNLVERFGMDGFRRGFLIPCVGDDLTDSFDTADGALIGRFEVFDDSVNRGSARASRGDKRLVDWIPAPDEIADCSHPIAGGVHILAAQVDVEYEIVADKIRFPLDFQISAIACGILGDGPSFRIEGIGNRL